MNFLRTVFLHGEKHFIFLASLFSLSSSVFLFHLRQPDTAICVDHLVSFRPYAFLSLPTVLVLLSLVGILSSPFAILLLESSRGGGIVCFYKINVSAGLE